MDTRAVIDRFLAGRRLAVVGVSRDPLDFSRGLCKELAQKGYDIVPVHPAGGEADGRKVYARVQDIPGPVDGAIVMTPAKVSAQIVRDCAEAEIGRVWLHRGGGQGAVSDEAVALCRALGLEVVVGECPLMFVGGSVHDTHRSIRRMTGSLPLTGEEQSAADRHTRWMLVALVAMELFTAIGALYGGGAMLLDPAGKPTGLPPPGELAGLRFGSYLIPGIVLLLANGAVPLAVAIGALARRRWSVPGHALAGGLLAGWTFVEIVMLGWISFLQPLMLAIGLALFGLGGVFWARKEGARRHLAMAA